MPRRPRIQLNGVPLHIVQRGHNREPCFFSEEDYTSYLHWLGEALGDNQCQLHAYDQRRYKGCAGATVNNVVAPDWISTFC